MAQGQCDNDHKQQHVPSAASGRAAGGPGQPAAGTNRCLCTRISVGSQLVLWVGCRRCFQDGCGTMVPCAVRGRAQACVHTNCTLPSRSLLLHQFASRHMNISQTDQRSHLKNYIWGHICKRQSSFRRLKIHASVVGSGLHTFYRWCAEKFIIPIVPHSHGSLAAR